MPESTDKLKVFVSYSRRDSAEFAEELVDGLELAGFAPFLDRHDIAPGEEWEARLGSLIRQADTVVYVISPEAIKSSRCDWEVNKALGESKRVLPIIFKSVPERDIPHELERRQFIRFDTGLGITRPLRQLAEALRQNIEWIREHTRISDLANRWDARARPESVLLRGEELSAARLWADQWKPGEPTVTDAMRAFLSASKELEAASFARAKAARRRMLQMQVLVGAFVAVIVTGLAAWWQQEWLQERVFVWKNVHVLTAAQEKALRPGDPPFKECTDCPEMIVMPPGKVDMGRDGPDGPYISVAVAKPFAVSKFEVTFDEWKACVADHGCNSYEPSDENWGRGARPVINVSWNDVRTYVEWLSRLTGKPYRLLSESEYEYAAEGGERPPYSNFGANKFSCSDCGSNWGGKQTAPVGSFTPNKFGLYDMFGNVWEWLEDCYHTGYDTLPTDGTAWISDNCGSRVVHGGAWDFPSLFLTTRNTRAVTFRSNDVGFRVGRTLELPTAE